MISPQATREFQEKIDAVEKTPEVLALIEKAENEYASGMVLNRMPNAGRVAYVYHALVNNGFISR
jgi:hypothetical protein